LFFHARDLPEDARLRDAFLLAAYGSPDAGRKQLDGLGGGTSNTSKVAIISDGRQYGVDVLYEFGQVALDRALIDRRGNCGNISSGVGPFAVDEGLVEATEPITRVRFLNVNTGKLIVAHVPTRNGRFDPAGDFALPGVPGTGSRVRLEYLDPGGAVTGALLPTGRVRDELPVPGVGTIPMSVVDAANPLVFVRWGSLGLSGTETSDEVDSDPGLLARIEAVRAHAAVLAGIAETPEQATAQTPSVPKLTFIGPPRDYPIGTGGMQRGEETTVRAAMMSMGRLHRTYALTGAICTAVAAAIPGTLAAEAAGGARAECRIGHPAGVLPMRADVVADGSSWRVASVTGYRTARRLMEGRVLVPKPWLERVT
jgi:2-methylaconitate cis-trans-isomerase PrpF